MMDQTMPPNDDAAAYVKLLRSARTHGDDADVHATLLKVVHSHLPMMNLMWDRIRAEFENLVPRSHWNYYNNMMHDGYHVYDGAADQPVDYWPSEHATYTFMDPHYASTDTSGHHFFVHCPLCGRPTRTSVAGHMPLYGRDLIVVRCSNYMPVRQVWAQGYNFVEYFPPATGTD